MSDKVPIQRGSDSTNRARFEGIRGAKMQQESLREAAMSIGKRSWASVVDGRGMSASAGPSLGRRVPWGARFTMGVNVEDTMKKSTAHGVKKVDFCMEVRHERL